MIFDNYYYEENYHKRVIVSHVYYTPKLIRYYLKISLILPKTTHIPIHIATTTTYNTRITKDFIVH